MGELGLKRDGLERQTGRQTGGKNRRQTGLMEVD
jgi:hypothetical protein